MGRMTESDPKTVTVQATVSEENIQKNTIETQVSIVEADEDNLLEDEIEEQLGVPAELRHSFPELPVASYYSAEPEEGDPREKVQDGGWGWVCVGACAVMAMIGAGFSASFSIIFVELMERFNSSAAVTAWVYSVFLAVCMCGGPVTTALLHKFGCRRCVMVGGVLMAACQIIIGYAPSLVVVFLSLALLGGPASSIQITSAFVIMGQYFDKNRSKAISITLIGRGIGTIIFAPVLWILLEKFGFSGAFLILGGCFLNNVALGALLRPPDRKRKSRDIEKLPAETEMQAISNGKVVEPLMNKQEVEEKSDCHTKRGIMAKISNALGLDLLKNPAALTFFCHMIFRDLALSICMVYVAGLAKDLGINKKNTAWCLSVFGLATIVTRVITGVIFDLEKVRRCRAHLYALNLVFLAATLLVSPAVTGFTGFMVMVVTTAVFIAVVTNQDMVIMADLVDKRRYTQAVGLATAFRGIGMIIGPPLGGMLHDVTGSYMYPWVTAGVCVFVSFLVFEGYYVCKKIMCCHNSNSENDGHEASEI